MNNEQYNNHAGQATDRLTQQDRIISKDAIMLPGDGKLTDAHIDAVRQALIAFITDDQGVQVIPNSRLAKEVGLSGPTISEFLSGKYRGNNGRVARVLNLWIDRQCKRDRARGRRDYISTWACERMAAYVRLADRRRKMAAIVAPSGAGKDMVIDTLADELGGVVIYCDTQTTCTRLIYRIAEAVGVKVTTNTAQLERRVIKRLKDRSLIIFINEAQTLAGRGKVGAKCAGLLLSIYDQTGVPICLFGSAEIFAFIDDRDPASGGGQLYRRCLKVNLLTLANAEADPDRPGVVGRPLFSKDEVRRFLAMKQVKLAGDDVFDILYHIANLTEHGTLGLCGDVVDAVGDLWPGDVITCEQVYTALAVQLGAELEIVQAKIDAAQSGNQPKRRAMAG